MQNNSGGRSAGFIGCRMFRHNFGHFQDRRRKPKIPNRPQLTLWKWVKQNDLKSIHDLHHIRWIIVWMIFFSRCLFVAVVLGVVVCAVSSTCSSTATLFCLSIWLEIFCSSVYHLCHSSVPAPPLFYKTINSFQIDHVIFGGKAV